MTYPYPGYPSPPPPYPAYQVPPAPIVITQPQPAQTRRDARDVSQLGASIIGRTAGLSAIAFGAVAALWLVSFVAGMSGSASERAISALAALGLALAVLGLPLVHATVSRNYRQEADYVLAAWIVATGLAGAGVAAMAISSAMRPSASPAESIRAVELRERYGISDSIWRHSARCSAPENSIQADRCERYQHVASGWLGSRPATPGSAALMAVLGLASVAGCGWIARFAMLGIAEAVRLPASEASPAAGGAAAGAAPEMAGTLLTPMQVFDSWFNARVVQDPSGRLSATVAFADYQAACALNGQPAMTMTAFGKLLRSKTENSGGRIGKIKTGGTWHYTGLRIAAEAEPIDVPFEDATPGFEGHPARS